MTDESNTHSRGELQDAEQKAHAERFTDLVRKAAQTPKSEYDKAQAERKQHRGTKLAKASD